MPASAAGSAVMMMAASSQDWKVTTISRYTSTIAIARPTPRPMKEDCMVCTWPRRVTSLPRLSCGRMASTSACTLCGHAGQVGALHADVDVDHRRDVVARDHGRHTAGAGLDQVAQQLRALSARRAAAPLAPTGMLSSASSESTLYCGVCTAML